MEPLVLSLSKDEPQGSWFDEPVLRETLILRPFDRLRAQDERRVEGRTTSVER